jgi:hypothetical protein
MKFTHDQDGTHYVLWRLTTGMLPRGGYSHIWAVETGWGSGYGQWIQLDVPDIAWSYLTEKMPGLREGDKPGLIALFKKAGLEVFG